MSSESGRLVDVLITHPSQAFVDEARIAAEWRALNFVAPPDLARAVEEYDRFLALVAECGACVHHLPPGDGIGLDAIYARDASVATPRGMVLCRMGKRERQGEPAAHRTGYDTWRTPIIGQITAPGTLEGGDVVWLAPRVMAVGLGYRTNADGIAQLSALVAEDVDEIITVPLVHWRGQEDVFHLMSILSPVDRDLAVVYSPIMPVPFRQRLLGLGYALVEVPDEEFESMGANVLATAPRECVMLDGNPRTRERLEAAGARVKVYSGREISLKGGGGPTCLTRPVKRE